MYSRILDPATARDPAGSTFGSGPEMRNAKRHVQRHCVASNVKPHGLSPSPFYPSFSLSFSLIPSLSLSPV